MNILWHPWRNLINNKLPNKALSLVDDTHSNGGKLFSEAKKGFFSNFTCFLTEDTGGYCSNGNKIYKKFKILNEV